MSEENLIDVSSFRNPLPKTYLKAIENARRPEATANERRLAHVIDALVVLLMLKVDRPRHRPATRA